VRDWDLPGEGRIRLRQQHPDWCAGISDSEFSDFAKYQGVKASHDRVRGRFTQSCTWREAIKRRGARS
jgi:hypothetical protein